MQAAIEIPFAALEAMMDDLERGPIGEGTDGDGRRFSITRYTSRSSGKRYDVIYTSGLDAPPRCIEHPGTDD